MSTNGDTTIRRAGRYAALLVALALPAAACAGSNSSGTAGGGSPSNVGSAGPVAYSACMRQHGVQNYPDPDSHGNLPKGTAQDFGVSNLEYQAAERACRHLIQTNAGSLSAASLAQCLMNGDGDCPRALVQQALTEGRTFARCMRSDGVPSWPDPTIDPTGRPSFQTTAAGISYAATRTSRMLAKIGHCQNQPGGALLRME